MSDQVLAVALVTLVVVVLADVGVVLAAGHDRPGDADLTAAGAPGHHPAGTYQAVRRNRLGDRAATSLEFALYAIPDYVLYLLAIQVLAFSWPVLPYQASQAASLPTVIADWRSMTLPITCSRY